jgi:hypothetical protein
MSHVLPDRNLPAGHPGLLARLHLDKRKAIILGAGGALLIAMLILSRRKGADTPAPTSTGVQPAANPTTAADGSSSGALGTPSTFADNGGQAAQLGNAVTSGLGDVGLSLAGLQASVDALTQTQASQAPATTLREADAQPPTQINISLASPPPATKGAPAGRPAAKKHAPAKTTKTHKAGVAKAAPMKKAAAKKKTVARRPAAHKPVAAHHAVSAKPIHHTSPVRKRR